jgi:hypothetical protein
MTSCQKIKIRLDVRNYLMDQFIAGGMPPAEAINAAFARIEGKSIKVIQAMKGSA